MRLRLKPGAEERSALSGLFHVSVDRDLALDYRPDCLARDGVQPHDELVLTGDADPRAGATFILTRRRLHDMELSGWFGLLHMAPLVNVFFNLWMNKYGLPPAPNTRTLVIAAWVLPIAFAASMPSLMTLEEKWIYRIFDGEAARSGKTRDPFASGNAPADASADTEAPAPAAPAPPN
ncbi:DUF805 domain-containing protein [Massilia sp. DJPM01]|uniref:DUF805 domain-containing protein n=1 Tax=Massilia sp. DJPM01 TaxID=3024404 RepID=UPI00259FAE7D|nr:DUF805 domain-containing protein [Massilia sp. DJPM01]MDM5177131.1 DUF805 domain-containing protein [Massilia sp. DJPM01]